jgi:dTDP-4-dehydrorhamnose 3,5-epimerase
MDQPRLIEGSVFVDDRGTLSFVNGFDFSGVKRFYMVTNHVAGFVRAWHGHKQEGKYVTVVSGAAVVGVVPLEKLEYYDTCVYERDPDCRPVMFCLSAIKPAVLWIPPGYANGFKGLTADTRLLFFSTKTVEESKGDDYRYPSEYHRQFFDAVER